MDKCKKTASKLTNWMSFKSPGTDWKYAVLNVIQLNGPAADCCGAAGFGGVWALFRLPDSTVTTVSDIISCYLFTVYLEPKTKFVFSLLRCCEKFTVFFLQENTCFLFSYN